MIEIIGLAVATVVIVLCLVVEMLVTARRHIVTISREVSS